MRRYNNRVISPVNAGGYNKGDPVDGATVSVYYPGTTTLATLYADEALTPLTNPVTTGTDGRFGFYIKDGIYDLAIFKSGVVNYTDPAVAITDSRAVVEVVLNDEIWFGVMNAYYDRNTGQWNRRDTSKLAWANVHNRTSDVFRIVRAPSGANPITWTTLFEINNAGKIVTGGNVDTQIFTGSGTWTKPAGVQYTLIEIVGAGAGGASGNGSVPGSGGGGGATVRRLTKASLLGATESVIVGVGGTAGVAGGASSFGALSVYGGGTGIAATSSSGGGGGGTGGVGASGVASANSLGGLPAQTAGAVGLSGQGGGGVNVAAGQPAEDGGGAGGGVISGGGRDGGKSMSGSGGGGGGASNGQPAGTGGATGSWGTGGGGAGAAADNTAGVAGANGGPFGEGAGGGGGRGTGVGGAGGAPGGGGGGGGTNSGPGGAGGRGEVRVYSW